ncbi:MAG: cytidylate kinase-like family protein [Treponema sp.]|nr:cytidylate kinase-like family protein [Treponema sp.]
MKKQLIISVGRQFGSAGHVIAKELAARFELPYYDSNLLDHIADQKNLDNSELKKYDERPKGVLFHRTVRGYSSSLEDNVAELQFNYLREMAKDGKSFVIVGRCAESVLKETDGLVSIFVISDEEDKISRIMETDKLSRNSAIALMKKQDVKRMTYHNNHCKGKWGDASNYDLIINSSLLGIEKTTDVLESYILMRTAGSEA